VKRSDGDEQIWIVIHIRMETKQEISLYSYLYLKLAKCSVFPCYLLCFFFNKIGEQVGRTGSVQRWVWGESKILGTQFLSLTRGLDLEAVIKSSCGAWDIKPNLLRECFWESCWFPPEGYQIQLALFLGVFYLL
jgi:hypothetical protein